ncbi:GntR family transcriptional regulator [Robertmurraya sp.]|uniref:GntR family transcriptional regulator n=1 Tax=Robertmurraya sp. TaxID=2837525 RepID=UPI003703CC2E
MIDRKAETPVYIQLKNFFMKEIQSGRLNFGTKIPSERDLTKQYNVSRATARQALSLLEREGFVERIVGSGTFVTNTRIQLDFITFNSFTNVLLDQGIVPATKMLKVCREEANPLIASKLNISSNEEIIVIKRLRFADGIPISIQTTHIPYIFCPKIEQFLKDNVSIYKILREEFNIDLVKTKQHMRVAYSNEEESKLLKIQSESPCLLLEEVTADRSGRNIDFSILKTRSDVVNYYSELSLD